MSPPVFRLIAAIDAFSERTGQLIAWLTFVMMILTCIVVVLRYGFSINFIALQESIGYLHAMVFLLGAAYTLKNDGHVRVDILYREFNARNKAWVNAVGAILFLFPVTLFLLFSSWEFTLSSWAVKESSANAGGIPAVFLLKSLIPITGLLLSLQGLAEVLRSCMVLRGDQS